MRTSKLLIAASIMMIIATASARAAIAPYGEVTGVSSDGTITINTGSDLGFESGDILVVQRKGLKVGLAHIYETNANTARAKIIRTESGVTVEMGDIVAYQLLDDRMAANWPLPDTRQFQETPDIMRKEWQSPEILTLNLDKIIEQQFSILEKQPYNRAAMLTLADAYFKKAWYEHAVMWSQRAIETNPSAEDNDKLVYQIIRSYGYLNQPERQALYISFLNKHYPNSVFAAMELSMNNVEGRMAEFKRSSQTITDIDGFMRTGMKYEELSGVRYNAGTPVKRIGIQSHLEGLEGKLLHASPMRISPQTIEPVYQPRTYENFHE